MRADVAPEGLGTGAWMEAGPAAGHWTRPRSTMRVAAPPAGTVMSSGVMSARFTKGLKTSCSARATVFRRIRTNTRYTPGAFGPDRDGPVNDSASFVNGTYGEEKLTRHPFPPENA